MADDAMDAEEGGSHRDVKAELDERRIARAVAIGLPVVTVTLTFAAGTMLGAPIAILVLAAGMLLGVIALFWASLRILSGDAALSPELEALDATAHAVDALASRKTMLVRALKDLENERALGKLEDDDFEQLSHTYRGELREVLTRIDASLEPHRPKAENAARAYLTKAGLLDDGYRGEQAPKDAPSAPESQPESQPEGDTKEPATLEAPARVECSKCETSNEPDATFCKKCGTSLTAKVSDEA